MKKVPEAKVDDALFANTPTSIKNLNKKARKELRDAARKNYWKLYGNPNP